MRDMESENYATANSYDLADAASEAGGEPYEPEETEAERLQYILWNIERDIAATKALIDSPDCQYRAYGLRYLGKIETRLGALQAKLADTLKREARERGEEDTMVDSLKLTEEERLKLQALNDNLSRALLYAYHPEAPLPEPAPAKKRRAKKMPAHKLRQLRSWYEQVKAGVAQNPDSPRELELLRALERRLAEAGEEAGK
jgi:hypothetical protein